ncbi:MarR family winged helix-turn-helix transcriptional regulator [Halosolutus halophilus]|uniref:MarR family winged helix-turn-helix transcriptional regulator n=1 Tax=Halosolutus halophilus TaxID=1552990 RepID=UPI0022352283|nr:MarR family winged helix-turn-helix transcriptional regulator [Halosolutus halophilus]
MISYLFWYAVLFLLWEREEVARKELAAAIDDDRFDLSHHLGDLVDVGFVARTGAPEGEDGRQTVYRITHLGRQEVDSDGGTVSNGVGTLPDGRSNRAN